MKRFLVLLLLIPCYSHSQVNDLGVLVLQPMKDDSAFTWFSSLKSFTLLKRFKTIEHSKTFRIFSTRTVDSLPPGNYKFIYHNLFEQKIKTRFSIKAGDTTNINIFPFVFQDKKWHRKTRIERLKRHQTLFIQSIQHACFMKEDTIQFTITKEKKEYFITKDTVKRLLTSDELKLIIQFEKEAMQLGKSEMQCTSNSDVTFQVNRRKPTQIEVSRFHWDLPLYDLE